MTEPRFRVSQMPSDFEPEGIDFDCGAPPYNEWFRTRSMDAVRSGSASVYLLIEVDAGRLAGYFSISPTTVTTEGLPRRAAGGLMRSAPGYLIGKLALSKELQGADPPLGPQLVLAAIAKVKSLVAYQEKSDEKLEGPEAKKLGVKKKEEIQKEIKKLE